MEGEKKKIISHNFTPAPNHTLSPPAASSSSSSLLIHEIRGAPKECNHPGVNVQHIPDISPSWLSELRQTALFLPLQLAFFSPFFFFLSYLQRDEDTQLRGAAPGDEEQGDATHRFPFHSLPPPPPPPTLSSPAIIVIIISLLSSNRTPLTLRWPFATFFFNEHKH